MSHPEPGETVMLPVARLLPCPVQPPVRWAQVEALVENWNLRHLHPVKVYRRDGQWWIRNGQHRWLAAQRVGVTELACAVVADPAKPWHEARPLHWWRVVDGEPVDPRASCTCRRCADHRERPPVTRGVGGRLYTRALDSDDNRSS